MKYTDSLQVGDTAYAWCGDVRRPVKVVEISNRAITTTPVEPMAQNANFGRRSGKGCSGTSSVHYLASAAGEEEVN